MRTQTRPSPGFLTDEPAGPGGPVPSRLGSIEPKAVMEALLVAALGSCVLTAAAPALRAFAVPGASVVLTCAAAGSVAVGAVFARLLRQPPPVSYTASLAGLVILLLASAGLHPGAIASALVHGPNRLLTETLPLAGGRQLLAPLAVITWAAGAGATELAVRTREGSRDASAMALALPVALYVVCYAVAASAPRPDRLAAPLLVLLLAVAAVARVQAAGAAGSLRFRRRDDDSPPTPWRALVSGFLATAVAAVAVGILAARAASTGGTPATVRRATPVATPAVDDPVDVMAALRQPGASPPPGRPDFEVVTDRPSDGYLALAVLDGYNGGQWGFDARFLPTGGRVPGGAGPLSASVSQIVEPTAPIPLPLLPALDRPISVRGPALTADAGTGMLLPETRTAAGQRWSIESEAPPPTLSDVPTGDGVDPELGAPGDTSLPAGTSSAIATTIRFLDGLTSTHPQPTIAFLQQVLSAMHTYERTIAPATAGSAASAAGTSLAQVINAITVDRAATPEQFATAFAMVARYLGVPARLVTGYRLVASSDGRPLPAGTYQATGADAWAWVEVPVSGFGWVVADPTPDATTASPAPPPEAVQAPSTTVPPKPATALPAGQILGAHALAPPVRLMHHRRTGTPAWIVAVAVAGGTIVLILLAGPGQAGIRRWWRRRRRRSPDARLLAIGAWLELMDGFSRAGLEVAPGVTNIEVAAEVAGHFGPDYGDPVRSIASVADVALYSTGEAPAAEAARGAWGRQREIVRQVTASLDSRARARALLRVGRPAERQG